TSTVRVASGDTEFNIDTPPKLHAHESAIYVLDDYDFTDRLRVNMGLRATRFDHVGPYTLYQLDSRGRSTGTEDFSTGKHIASYMALEPRLSGRYTLGPNSSLKASFNRGQQYVHLVSFSSLALPTDVWLPSSSKVKPQIGTQYSAGYFHDLFNDVFETSVEVYYKDFKNLIEYANGAQPQSNGNTNYDAQLVFGKGYSYGAEFFVKKRTGKLTGWLGYTWSKTMRKFPGLNNGDWYPSRWDRRHDLSLVVGYEHNKRWSFGGTFVYATGQAVTVPVNRYFVEGQLVSDYTEKNGYRMAAYHRLDLSATRNGRNTKMVWDFVGRRMVEVPRKWHSSWTFGVYNAYNRRNPYFIYFASTGSPADGSFAIQAKQVSLFSILPSVTWNFKF
ncbi:MAG TPA: TonB-dependent receptor, partial [Flavobacteriales bacterium]|nr:TonB-dependent receptor [Flavobacteriales bacterium]